MPLDGPADVARLWLAKAQTDARTIEILSAFGDPALEAGVDEDAGEAVLTPCARPAGRPEWEGLARGAYEGRRPGDGWQSASVIMP